MTAHEIRPELLYPDRRLFLDYVASSDSAVRLFSNPPDGFAEAARVRQERGAPREPLADALEAFNERIGASEASLANVARLRDATTVCVIGGQQAGFLGGPLYTVYKILSIVRLSSWLAETLSIPVVPVFWIATEDHDFTEINRAVFLEEDGALRTISFDWRERGRPIEELPITPEVADAAEQALARLSDDARIPFEPGEDNDYGTWHARIWSRLFADEGLVLVEPRVVRPLCGPFFQEALRRDEDVTRALRDGAESVRAAGYEPLLDADRAGTLFRFDETGARVRVVRPADHIDRALEKPSNYSPDAALRPILADRLFPTVANVLGPGEIEYHALLRPLYELFGVPQPIAAPRSGYTLLADADRQLVETLGIPVERLFRDDFDPNAILEAAASPSVRSAFDGARDGVRAVLEELRPQLLAIDPSLEARWRQTADHVAESLDRLEERARRTDLGQRSVSAKRVRRLLPLVRPAAKPQERVLSLVHVASQFGVEWLKRLPGSDRPDRFAHWLTTIRGGA